MNVFNNESKRNHNEHLRTENKLKKTMHNQERKLDARTFHCYILLPVKLNLFGNQETFEFVTLLRHQHQVAVVVHTGSGHSIVVRHTEGWWPTAEV